MHAERQIVPSELRVSTAPISTLPKSEHSTRRRFNDSDWQASQLRRELRDRPSFTEAVTLEADHMLTVFVDHATKRETGRRVVMFAPAPAEQLAIAAELPPAFEIAPTIQQEATVALAKLNYGRRAGDYQRRASDRRMTTMPPRPLMTRPTLYAAIGIIAAAVCAFSMIR
jgi:hypothetical protein